MDLKYRLHTNELLLVRFWVVFSLAFVLYLGFSFFDYIIYPSYAPFFLKIRISCAAITSCIFLLSLIKRYQSYAMLFMEINSIILVSSVLYMIYLTDGSASRYYEGLNLVYIALGFVNAYYYKRNLVVIVILLTLYNIAVTMSHAAFNPLNYWFANYFMGSTGLAIILMTKFYGEQHYRAFVNKEELAVSNKELEQFAYVASHDLQEPLRMVDSFCQKLKKKYYDKLDQDANECIHFAVDGAQRMRDLINALLSYAKVGKKGMEIEQVDLNKTLSTILHDLDMVIKEKQATIKVGDLPVIMADHIQMSQLFQNFLTNALKFKGERNPVVEVSATRKADEWEFKVSDNGIGIEEKNFPKIFEIFQRVREQGAYPGTGIGLALCKKIVDNFKGRIWVSSKVGQGTTFHFTLRVKTIA